MASKQYWSQHKIFFIATLVLFPDKLTERPLDPWFSSPFFNFAYSNNFDEGLNKDDPTLELATVILDDYKRDGYIKYKKVNGLYEIIGMDIKKAERDLVQYLQQWQHDELLAISAGKPPDPERQKELLLAAIVRDYSNHKNRQRITLEDVFGKPGSHAYKPTFWELVLSYQLLDKKIEITYMDYGKREDWLYNDDYQPTVELKIVDQDLASSIKRQSASAQFTPPDNEPQSVSIAMTTEGAVYANIANNKHLIKKLRRDSAPYNFMNYMLGHQNQDTARGVVQSEVDGCAAKNDMTELAKACGFTKELQPLKAKYFGGTTKTKVHFTATAELARDQIELLVQREIA